MNIQVLGRHGVEQRVQQAAGPLHHESCGFLIDETLEYEKGIRETFNLEAKGSNGDPPRNRAEWARMMASEIKQHGIGRTEDIGVAIGEAIT